ncbi:MAG: phosphopantetheine-binding protein [Rhizobiales bacterium]|nr:phosphopantetheine-binding protein [Hyphomicrobiales bacterium]
MTRESIIEAIGSVLREEMRHPHLDRFGPQARLNEDLYIDSVQLLQLILALELNLGLPVSEEAFSRQDLVTVADLAAILAPEAEREPPAAEASAPEAPSEGVHGEMSYDLKIHCFVSCVCAGLKTRGIDHRPFHFLIWDAEFAITDGFRLAYHSDVMDHESFRYWFERLYGVPLVAWYDHSRSKDENVGTLLDILAQRRPDECVMVMLDMFHLPERENKFNQNPFPHYLLLELTEDPAVWQVRDHDFRWEGLIARDKLLNAIRQPSVAGGYRFDHSVAHPPADADLAAFFTACLRPGANPLIDAVRSIVTAHAEGQGGLALADVGEALRELPVVTIRKWAYEHGFAFFWRALRWPDSEFQRICDEIEMLVNGLTALHYAILKLARTGDAALVAPVIEKLDALDAVEFSIKRQLAAAFKAWRAQSPGIGQAGQAHERLSA